MEDYDDEVEEEINLDKNSFDRLKNLQSLIKKESSLKELCNSYIFIFIKYSH